LVLDQYFITDSQGIKFCVVICLRPDGGAPSHCLYREFVWRITDDTIWYSMLDFRRLGFSGEKLTDLDRSSPSFHDLSGTRVDAVCSLEPYFTDPREPGPLVEMWQLFQDSRRLKDMALLQHFDELLTQNPKSAHPDGSQNEKGVRDG
jgi:hypothetical protein